MHLRRSVLSFLLLIGLSVGALSPARAAEDPGRAPASAAQIRGEVSNQISEHLDAISKVEELAPGGAEASNSKITPARVEGRDATLDLRDTFLRMRTLSRTDQKIAVSAYKRPWFNDAPNSAPKCGVYVCVHWLSAADAEDPADASTPEWAQTVLDTVEHVAAKYRAAGYRPLPSDGTYGGDSKTDIYLYGVGGTVQNPTGLYGYCSVDSYDGVHATFPQGNSTAYPAFCALDNDYSEFPGQPERNLQVTAAHEYFHAVQFAYDYLEDRWFMEATATWAEDEVYSPIDDNVQYLQRSQLRYAGLSLDTFNGAGGFLQYGDWIFFRYLTERIPASQYGMPILVRRMWQLADSVSGPDLYSIQAIARALAERGVSFNRIFAQYAAANRHPASAYAEGRANHYPVGAPRRTVRLKPGKRTASGAYRVNHLASATVRFVPKRLRPKRTKLTLSVDMANRKAGSMAVALVFFKNGRVATRIVRLGRAGNGKVRVPFSTRRVARVELVLVNTNHSYRRCWSNTVYSCGGIPRLDGVKERFSAKVS